MLLVSADSHVIEPGDLWSRKLPASMRSQAPVYETGHGVNPAQAHDGGYDPVARVREMEVDGVSAEVLYPTFVLDQFSLTDPALQEACFRIYNDWLIEFCAHSPDRLFGIACISLYNIGNAIAEMKRCKAAGMRGVMIWQVAPLELPFNSPHYEKFWAAAEELEMPISLHILTGYPFQHGWSTQAVKDTPLDFMLFTISGKIGHVSKTLVTLMISGVMERHPRLKFVFVENEVSWMPFILSQLDKYDARAKALKMPPSAYFERQVFGTFFNDPPIQYLFGQWGTHNCMWSNDFPHSNSTWPNSRQVIARDLGALPPDVQERLLSGNVMRMYGIEADSLAEVA